jgi:hypothetical protein
MPTGLFLGSVVTPHAASPVGYIPSHSAILRKEWTLGAPPKSSRGQLDAPEKDSVWQQYAFNSLKIIRLPFDTPT